MPQIGLKKTSPAETTQIDGTARLAALAEAQMLLKDAPEFLKDLVELTHQVLGSPIALVSFVSDSQQVFKSQHGLSGPVSTALETPLSHSFCQHVVMTGQDLRVDASASHPLVCNNLAVKDLDIKAYAGTPIYNPDGYILGSLCAIETQARDWLDRDFAVLRGFSKTITAELESRRYQKLMRDQAWEFNTNNRALVNALKATQAGVWFWKGSTEQSFWPDETCDMFGFMPGQHPDTLADFQAYLSPQDGKNVAETIKNLSPENPSYDLKFTLNAPLWECPKWVRSCGQAQFDEHGKIIDIAGFMSIIDAAQRAAQHTQKLADRYERLTNHAPVMIAELDSQLRYIFANNSYANLFGTTPAAITDQHARDILGADAFALAEPHMKAVLDGQAVEYDLELQTKNGEAKFLKARYAPEYNDENKVTSFIAAVSDMTAQTHIEREASALDMRLKAAHNLSPDGFMMFSTICNDEGKITDFKFEYTNEAGAKIGGQPASQITGKNLLDVFPGNVEQGLFDAYVNVVETGEPFETEEFYDQDDIQLWLEITAIKVGSGFAVSFSDISQRKRQEAEIANNAVRLQRVLDNVIAFVGTLSPDGVLKDVNRPALEIAGLSREDVLEKPFWQAHWWSHSPETQQQLKDAINAAKAGQASRYDVPIRVSNDLTMTIDFQLNPVFDADGRVIELIASGIDIENRLKAETHRDLLIGELNHRVKNSLATIQAMARQTIRSSETLDDFEAAFSARLSAISSAHDILMASHQGRASLKTMIERQIGPYVDEGGQQLKLSGDDVMLSGPSAHAIGLVLHELSTNAAKYGSLSVKGGHIDIAWHDSEDGMVHIGWQEVGGPKVIPPKRKGFGTRLIKQSLEYALGGSAELSYAADGFTAKLTLPMEAQDE